jgi:hypothetical protein
MTAAYVVFFFRLEVSKCMVIAIAVIVMFWKRGYTVQLVHVSAS